MIKDSGNAFYANDTRFFRATFNGFTQANTDKGVLYYTLAISGGTATLTFYKWGTYVSGDAVCAGSASVSPTTMTEITLSESNSSGMSDCTAVLDLRTSLANITDGKAIITLSFDDDFKLYEKTIADWADSNDQYEGEGVEGCAFVRVHRAATVWAIVRLRDRLKGMVGYDASNLPDLFDVELSIEDARDAAVNYALSRLYFNQKNTPLSDGDPHSERASIYEQRAESRIANVRMHLDLNQDGVVDKKTTSAVGYWS